MVEKSITDNLNDWYDFKNNAKILCIIYIENKYIE